MIDKKATNDVKFQQYLQGRGIAKSTQIFYSSLIDRFLRYYGHRTLDWPAVDDFIRGREGKAAHWWDAEESGAKPYKNHAPRKFAMIKYLDYRQFPVLVEKIKTIKSRELITSDANKIDRTFDMNDDAAIMRFTSFLRLFAPREKLLYRVMFQTACRISGIVKLKVEDITYDKIAKSPMLSLYKKGAGANGYSRPIDDLLYADIQRFIYSAKLEPNSYLFRNKRELERSASYRIWSELKVKSHKFKLKSSKFGISPHYVRHARADNLYNNTDKNIRHDLMRVMRLLGHKSIATTQIYLKTSEKEAQREAVELIKSEKVKV